MKKFLLIVCLVALALGCHIPPGTEPDTGGVSFDLDLVQIKAVGYTIVQVSITLTHQTTTDSKQQNLTVDNNSENATGLIRNLRPGTWDIDVALYDSTGLVTTGTGTAEVTIGATATATIYLTVGGDLSLTVIWRENLFSLFNGQVIITQVPSNTLAPGVGAHFVYDLNLPEGTQYRVWITVADYEGPGNNGYYSGSPELEYNATNVNTGSDYRPVIYENSEFSSYATGTATEWNVRVVTWNGTNNTDYLEGTFLYSVTWE